LLFLQLAFVGFTDAHPFPNLLSRFDFGALHGLGIEGRIQVVNVGTPHKIAWAGAPSLAVDCNTTSE
jgi:hypothetical protein